MRCYVVTPRIRVRRGCGILLRGTHTSTIGECYAQEVDVGRTVLRSAVLCLAAL